MLRESPPAEGDAEEQSGKAARPKPGDVVAGKYRIEKVIGEGGMGVVFAARHVALDKVVALKVLLADAMKGDDVVERFVREAQAAARIQSEHVARVMDAGSLENGVPFLAMEYLEGCDLEELLRLNKQLPIADAVDYVLQALAAMAQAHAAGIVHRDLKPSNLFLAVRPDGSNIIKILDFGISKQTAARRGEKALTGRAVLGSPAYMPPEQLRNATGVDARADLWALGIVLYELLAGVPPFDGEGVGEIFAAILEQDPPSLPKIRPDVPAALESAILVCLKRDLDQRWQTAAELSRVLTPFGSGRWSHVAEGIEQTLARSAMRKPSATGHNLIAAANEALKSLRPPPPPPALPEDSARRTSPRVAFARESGTDLARGSRLDEPTLAQPRHGITTQSERWTYRGRSWAIFALFSTILLTGGAALTQTYLQARAATSTHSAPAGAAPLPAAANEPRFEAPVPSAANEPRLEAPVPSAASTPDFELIDVIDPSKPASSSAARAAPPRRAVASPQPGKPATRPKFLNSRD